MPESTKNGMEFWAFPAMPYDVHGRTKALREFFLNTSTSTGEIDTQQWAVYPNNATPRNLRSLLKLLQKITTKNADTIDIGWTSWGPKAVANKRFQERLDYYTAAVNRLYAEFPDVMVGDPSSAASEDLFVNVVNPLFLGWYPNAQVPFATQPGPFSHQTDRATPDSGFPFIMANEIAVGIKFQNEAWERLRDNLYESARRVLDPAIFTLSLLPVALAMGFGFAVFSRLKK